MSACTAPTRVQGGRRRSSRRSRSTRKMSKGASDWTSKVVKLYRKMKSSDSSVKFGDALKAASKLKKQGKL